jgi:RNA polymerase subunit RPABC4/transcription elongation factor Spt4
MSDSDTELQDDKVPCASCGSQIARTAKLCPVCRSYTSQWKNSLTFFGSLAGGIAIITSAAAYLAGQGADWYGRLTWHDTVEAVYFEHPGFSGFLNAGSGDVVLESYMIEWPGEPGKTITISVNALIPKGQFSVFDGASPFGKPNHADTGIWAVSQDGRASAKLMASAADKENLNRCAEYHFHNNDHVTFRRIEELRASQGKLIEVPATVRLNFISIHTAKPVSLVLPNMETAFLYFPDNPGCKGQG